MAYSILFLIFFLIFLLNASMTIPKTPIKLVYRVGNQNHKQEFMRYFNLHDKSLLYGAFPVKEDPILIHL